jgi:hypothetical protein
MVENCDLWGKRNAVFEMSIFDGGGEWSSC